MDKHSAMRTFVWVVESGSFCAVANELRATQSAGVVRLNDFSRESSPSLLVGGVSSPDGEGAVQLNSRLNGC